MSYKSVYSNHYFRVSRHLTRHYEVIRIPGVVPFTRKSFLIIRIGLE